jgi:tRNA 5-methylaminomethyl-2-thiouridine biosynthesis bifunctional protein
VTTIPIEPADLEFDDSGNAFSRRYGDVYASRDGALGQARHVFLGGNALPSRWAQREQFVIFETGFGLGVNFLATWQQWRDDPLRPRRLHFVSVELHPPRADDLRRAAAPLESIAAELAAAWPLPLPGLHRLEFEDGGVVLTLGFGDAAALVPRLALGADAFFLDGFAPDRNPVMWSAPLLKSLARMARRSATLATWCTARTVRDALAASGFVVERRAGFGHKRAMLAARFEPRW